MRRRLIIIIGMVIFVTSTWSQSVQMELTDIWGDKKLVDIKGGMSVYLPQSLNPTEYDMVICDEKGEPFFSLPMSELALIRYKNTASLPDADLDVSSASEKFEDSFVSKWNLNNQTFQFYRVGEWTYDKNLTTKEVTTAYGQHFRIPLKSVQQIAMYRDTVTSIGSYLMKLMGDEGYVYRWAFYDGMNTSSRMGLNMFALVADEPSLNYTLFAPTDEAMSHYIDIPSFPSRKPRVLNLSYRQGATNALPLQCSLYNYNPISGEVGYEYQLDNVNNDEITNRLAMILRSHIILHNRPEDKARGLRSGNDYYQALDGSVVRVIKDDQGNPIAVQGAFQMQNEQNGLNETVLTGQSEGAYEKPWNLTRVSLTEGREKANGWIYKVDGIMDASPRSAYSVLSADGTFPEDNPFGSFIALCMPNEEILHACGLASQNGSKNPITKYRIFDNQYGFDYNLNFIGGNSFTMFVPTNEAIQAEVAKGLPTWAEIQAQYEALPKDEYGVPMLTSTDSANLQQKCLKLTNFVRAHIQYGMEIADQLPFTREHNTTVVKANTLATPRLRVQGLGNGKMTVTDETGNTCNIVDERKNIFVRDLSCSRSPVNMSSMNNIKIIGYSNGVIHQIDGVLKYNE